MLAQTCPVPRKRGPKPPISDEELLGLIRTYLETSPFAGEGHRKVYAHLKIVRGVRTSRTRILRLMRENSLLSPYRRPCGAQNAHDGTITTDTPNLVWGTDGFRVQTVEEGWVWGFIAVDHFNSECVGHHVCKEGNRFNALEPIRMGLDKIFGTVGRDAALGLALRMDHGCQYTSDHFLNQIAYWGIAQSFSFVAQPQGNGIAERFIKTLKQQRIYGHVFRNAQEVYQAVASFVQEYNHLWRIERLRFLTPAEARNLALQEEAA
jgi:transposase InsO family protein